MAHLPAEEADPVLADELHRAGLAVRPGVVPVELVAELVAATDRAVAAEADDFPAGDEQHGRSLFAPAHGGAFLDLLGCEELFGPMEAIVGDDAILYTMTTSVLAPRSTGPVDRYHVDLGPDRPAARTLTAMVLLDRFTARNGATEFLAGSHRWPEDRVPGPDDERTLVLGAPGDVCFFDPRARHRSTPNRSDLPRRAVLVLLVPPWMKQRVDVVAMTGLGPGDLPARASRRLGLASLPPATRAAFRARRDGRPWS